MLAFFLVLVHQLIEHTWLMHLPRWQHFISQMLFYGLIGPSLAWWALTSIYRSVQETERAERALKQTHAALQEANQRLEFLVRVNHQLAEAEDEDALIETILALPLQVVPAVGCSLIRFDEKQRPAAVFHHGDMASEAFENWKKHLAASETRQRCQHCGNGWALRADTCPLLEVQDPLEVGVEKVYCLRLTRGKRNYGVLNILLANSDSPDERQRILLHALAQEMSLALESMYLRSRELDTLYHLQRVREPENLHNELNGVLEHVVAALEMAGGVLFLAESGERRLKFLTQAGQPLGDALGLVRGLANSAFETSTPIVISDLAQQAGGNNEIGSLLIAPMNTEQELLGCMALWSAAPHTFSRRQVQLVAAVAGQAGLLVENHRLYLQAEGRVVLSERARLAREIHDGLAQTLGYLQLRIAQIQAWFERGESERVPPALAELQTLIDEAYTDAREAIDGLRLQPRGEGLHDWVPQVLSDFQHLSGMAVTTNPLPDIELPLAVQVQLIRILQEALGNVRKHSGASRAWVDWQLDQDWLTLRIVDDGCGFNPEDVPRVARYGLRIMRERAELLDADFQIVSRAGEGTQVVLRMPVRRLVERQLHE